MIPAEMVTNGGKMPAQPAIEAKRRWRQRPAGTPAKLLVPLDGSASAERALAYAVALASAVDGQIVLIRVATGGTGGPEEAEVGAYLTRQVRSLPQPSVLVSTIIGHGRPAQAILKAASDVEATCFVMATHARSGPAHWLFGGVAEAVLREASVPVLLIGARGREPAQPPSFEWPVLLVPLDGSAFAEAALPVAENLAKLLQGRIVLLRATASLESMLRAPLLAPTWSLDYEPDFEPDDAGSWMELVEQQARACLDRAARRLDPHLTVTQDVRTGQEASAAIAAACHEHHVTLVVMSTHGRAGLSRLVFGSVAADVLRQDVTPLLLVRPTAVRFHEADVEAGLDIHGRETAMPSEVRANDRASQSGYPVVDMSSVLVGGDAWASAEPETSHGSWFEHLVDTVEVHIQAEDETLLTYRRLETMSADPIVSLLTQMVLQDEERHHQLLRRMAATLRDGLNWSHSPEALPLGDQTAGSRAATVRELVRSCISQEREGARHMRRLARQDLRTEDGLYELLLEIMAMDSGKHERIMRYLLRRIERVE